MLYTKVTKPQFHDLFRSMGRENNFTYEGREALYDYLEELSDEPQEVDIIGLCCEFNEFLNIEAYNEDYGTEHEDWDEVEEVAVVFTNEAGEDGAICYEH